MESIVLILFCLVGSAFFSGSETALLRLRGADLDALEREPGPAASATRELVRSTSRLLVTILLGNNIANILGAAVASALAVAWLGPELGVAMATLAMTVLVFVFCEVLPKAVAAAHPRGISRFVALPLYLLHQAVRPVHRGLALAIDPVVQRIAGAREQLGSSAEEVLRLARQTGVADGTEGAAAIIGHTARAAEMTVQEIMVDRTEIVAFQIDAPPAKVLEQMLDERYTRVPVYEQSIDLFAGIVHLKDLVMHVRAGGQSLRTVLRPVLRVPERKPILALLAEMQRTFMQMAIVKDENGLTEGIVTTEDILEELVGEIRDEYDQEELQSIQRRGGAYEALGRVKVLDFNRETSCELPAEPGDTLSALVFNQLGRAAHPGDRVPAGDHEVEVLEISGPRIVRVRVARTESAAPE